jgi:predicted phosphoribosyltransferase
MRRWATRSWFSRKDPGLPFVDRDDAGERLAHRVAETAAARAAAGDPWPPPVVLAIPRGGLPVAAAIARELGAPLDVLVAHKLGAPFQPELAIGAVASDGTVLVEPWAADLAPDPEWLSRAVDAELERTRAHEQVLRAGRPAPRLVGRTALLVDDGIATGATVRVGVLAARAAGAARVVVAAPVGAGESVESLRQLADKVVVLATPDPFYAVGEFYVRFDQVDDAQVREILRAAEAASSAGPTEEAAP